MSLFALPSDISWKQTFRSGSLEVGKDLDELHGLLWIVAAAKSISML
jgi:hypothetical protein